ncbi:hypothetical protein BOTU111921_00040 [Bordetella tumbae]|uniref:Csu type fimbrial protein n=1 Tax=Bordetella tumbae TaxID=1649139 RepID=UPI0039F101B4
MMFSKRWIAVCAVMTTFGQMSIANAGSISGQIGVQMVIEPSCMVTSGSDASSGTEQWGTLDFGTHSDLVNTKNAQFVGVSGNAALEISCSQGLTSAVLTIDGEMDGDLRYMTNTSSSSSRIAYRLYADSAFNLAISAGVAVESNGPSADKPRYMLFGRAQPTEQSIVMPAAGTYTDTLLATLTW